MRAILLLLLAVARQSVALWDCPFPIEDLPTYKQIAQQILKSLNTSLPKDVLAFGNAHAESVKRLHCASAAPAVRAGTTLNDATIFRPILWPNRTVYYSLQRLEYTPAAVTRLEAEIKWVNDNTCVSFEEVATCSAGEKCVVITHPSEKTLQTYTPVGCPPDDYKDIYYVSRTIELVENYGILDWIMWVLGFMQDHNRFDRDKYLTITQLRDDVDSEWMTGTFLKNVQTDVDTVFPYDPQSATHMTIVMANYYGVNLTTLDPAKHVIKETPDGVLSPIDIQKVHYYYCHDNMLTSPVSSRAPERQSPADTTTNSAKQTTTSPATTSPISNTTATSTTAAPTSISATTTPATTITTTTPATTTTTTTPATTTTTTTPATTTTTTTTTVRTTPDPRFTLAMKFDGLDGESLDEFLDTTTTPTTSTTTNEATTTTTESTTAAFPMTSPGQRLPELSFKRMLESALLLVTIATYWLC